MSESNLEQLAVRARPQSQPSKDIFNAVLDATGKLIIERGVDGLTTNHIAKAAGISIGSFYRYFKNKETAVAELLRRREKETVAQMLEAIAETGEDATFRERVNAGVKVMVAGGRPGTDVSVRRVHQTVPRGWLEPVSFEADASVRVHVIEMLKGTSVKDENLDTLAFIIIYAIEKLVETAVWREPELLEDPDFTEQLTELVVRFAER